MMIASLRQWFYPKEFRIKGYGVSLKKMDLNEEINRIEDIIKKVIDSGQVDTDFIKDIATSVWRIEKRMAYIAEHNKATRVTTALKMMKDILTMNKIEIKDYTGKRWEPPYDEMSWEDVKGSTMQKGGTIRMVEPKILYDKKIIKEGK